MSVLHENYEATYLMQIFQIDDSFTTYLECHLTQINMNDVRPDFGTDNSNNGRLLTTVFKNKAWWVQND
jgi:hypothetical protein